MTQLELFPREILDGQAEFIYMDYGNAMHLSVELKFDTGMTARFLAEATIEEVHPRDQVHQFQLMLQKIKNDVERLIGSFTPTLYKNFAKVCTVHAYPTNVRARL